MITQILDVLWKLLATIVIMVIIIPVGAFGGNTDEYYNTIRELWGVEDDEKYKIEGCNYHPNAVEGTYTKEDMVKYYTKVLERTEEVK